MQPLPPIYSFPPLYTRQPNSIIRNQQLNAWIDLILQYARENKCWTMAKTGTSTADPKFNIFHNESIQRSVSPMFIDEIWALMIKQSKAIVNNDNNNNYFILWQNIDSWASLILQWFEDSNKLNQVVTIYELSQGDETINWEFHQMPEPLLILALKPLCKRNRATMLKDEDGAPIAIKVI
ncbi:hypothetical protein NCAS_0H00500 [Naumovozyma castellii]|uniref:Vacuolar protein-sorting-associated protein 25 n=1 Tax=Naumovozyma castellii TaxID=27288 RepID=G0VIN4_NAUCA|nr:hypothetical protein NCAS_0H00500 [Naumovozyma castellii CBS 4309]CCC71360.1 hypothetical protein NCAS_0H00500 [Naumovozyma castellii CBS 4309]